MMEITSLAQTKPITNKEHIIQFDNLLRADDKLQGRIKQDKILQAKIIITPYEQRNDITHYHLYWATNNKKIIGEPITIFTVATIEKGDVYQVSEPLIYAFNHIKIPATATHLLVYVQTINEQVYLYATRDIWSSESLLPLNASSLEKSLAIVSQRLNQLPILLDTFWDPSQCPEHLLQWLAWGVSVDYWYGSSKQKILYPREIIRQNANVHRYKGTIGAIKSALKSQGVEIDVTEWWQQEPKGDPFHFSLDLVVNRNFGLFTADINDWLYNIVDKVKPVRSHYNFNIIGECQSGLCIVSRLKTANHLSFNFHTTLPQISVESASELYIANTLHSKNHLYLNLHTTLPVMEIDHVADLNIATTLTVANFKRFNLNTTLPLESVEYASELYIANTLSSKNYLYLNFQSTLPLMEIDHAADLNIATALTVANFKRFNLKTALPLESVESASELYIANTLSSKNYLYLNLQSTLPLMEIDHGADFNITTALTVANFKRFNFHTTS